MELSRRDFMKSFGVALASLALTRCKVLDDSQNTSTPPIITEVTCYLVAVQDTPTPTPVPHSLGPKDRVRVCWLSFNLLAESTLNGRNQSEGEVYDPLGEKLMAEHRIALDELVVAGEVEAAVADLIQEAYAAAVYHVWRSNAPITCYEPMMVNYAPTSAGQLVQQSTILAEMAEKGDLSPETVTLARETIEHDLAFEALSNEEVQALYQDLLDASPQGLGGIPGFDQVELATTPEMEAAAAYLVGVLAAKD
jgi:hypothetical protein